MRLTADEAVAWRSRTTSASRPSGWRRKSTPWRSRRPGRPMRRSLFTTLQHAQQHPAAEQLHHRRQRDPDQRDASARTAGFSSSSPGAAASTRCRSTARKTTTSAIDSRFNPQLSSNLAASFTQPLLRNFGSTRSASRSTTSRNNQVIADLGLREQVAITTQAVRNAYFDLIGAIEGQKVARQSLDLALALAQEQPDARRSRHAGADRHHRGGGRGRARTRRT